jgi:2-polyprenyl-6-methoxyphenol hydroxylase-like FAD-dependent oxidoreductase
VASAVGAPTRVERAPLTLASYTYWEGVELSAGEIYALDGASVGVWPTNNCLTMTYVARPAARSRTDPEHRLADFRQTLDRCGDLGERIRSAHQAERLRSTLDVPNRIRRSRGNGWVLIGDAGAVMDPITGQGMADALRDAELVSDAVAAGLDGTMPLDRALATYEKRRDASLKPMFDMTVRLAALRPAGRFERALFEALAARPADADRFFAITTGAAAQSTLFNPVSLARLFGARRLAGLMVGRQAPSHPRPA